MSVKRLLVVVDMQHDFVDGALGTPETRVLVAAEACAGTSPAAHEAALLTLKSCQTEIL